MRMCDIIPGKKYKHRDFPGIVYLGIIVQGYTAQGAELNKKRLLNLGVEGDNPNNYNGMYRTVIPRNEFFTRGQRDLETGKEFYRKFSPV